MTNKKKVGRKPKEITRSERLEIRLTKRLKESLREYARHNNLTMSQVVEIAIETFIFEEFE
jgi:predicted DNA-binding protein